jgi:hypothetical protein
MSTGLASVAGKAQARQVEERAPEWRLLFQFGAAARAAVVWDRRA